MDKELIPFIVLGPFLIGAFFAFRWALYEKPTDPDSPSGKLFSLAENLLKEEFIKLVEEKEEKREAERAEKENKKYEGIMRMLPLLKIPESLAGVSLDPIYKKVRANTDNISLAYSINLLFEQIPPMAKISLSGGTTWKDFVQQALVNETPNVEHAIQYIGKEAFNELERYTFKIVIPNQLRTEHMQIIAGSGQGKSECIKSMVIDDLEEDCSIVVIDSQGDIIRQLTLLLPTERLILIDPNVYAPSINLFHKPENERDVNTAVEFYEYIFSALDAQMTSKQQTAYRFVSRLLLVIPNATIHTMREILETGTKHQEHVPLLSETVQSFFYNEFNSRQFAETRSQILRRLYTVLENSILEEMLGASESKIDIPQALNSGKVVLINTAKDYLKQTGSTLFGRIFIAQVMQAVMARGNNRKRTYMYIDEFQDYAEDSHVLFNLFEQSRKYNLGLIVAHQYLGQLPPKLQQSISANTAIKFAGGVSAQDGNSLARQMDTTPEFIQSRPKGHFAGYFKGMGVVDYPVQLGRGSLLSAFPNPVEERLSAIHKDMKEKYGTQARKTETKTEKKGEW